MYKKLFSILFAATIFSSPVKANNQAISENMVRQLSQQLEVSMKVMNDPKLIKANAKYIRSLYNALIEEGFNKEQAMQLVSASLSSKK